MTTGRVRVVRLIARLNIGGPAHHVSILSGRLERSRFETVLVAGSLGPGEGGLEDVARACGADLRILRELGPEIRPWADVRAFVALAAELRRQRPDIVHTHTAKAGALGRLAALLVLRPRPIIVHTYHGHVLTGYFGNRQTQVFRIIERWLARRTDCLVAVSDSTADELVALNVAGRDRFRVIPLGLDLDHLYAVDGRWPGGDELRAEFGVSDEDVVCTFVGRLVPIKRVDLLLDAIAEVRQAGHPVVLAVAGDGPERTALESRSARLGLRGAVHFLGFRRDLATIAAASDLAVLSSDNEGTPVALIEAAAAGRPAVATDVGGVRDIVVPETGRVVPAGDARAFADALAELAGDPELRLRLGAAARQRAAGRWTPERLLADVQALYDELLAARGR